MEQIDGQSAGEARKDLFIQHNREAKGYLDG